MCWSFMNKKIQMLHILSPIYDLFFSSKIVYNILLITLLMTYPFSNAEKRLTGGAHAFVPL